MSGLHPTLDDCGEKVDWWMQDSSPVTVMMSIKAPSGATLTLVKNSLGWQHEKHALAIRNFMKREREKHKEI